MKLAIIIPARYGSRRFPGKPLALLAGEAMIDRVFRIASQAKQELQDRVEVFIGVATDDQRIYEHCAKQHFDVCLTSPELTTGTDRALAALDEFKFSPDIVVSLQGDNPLAPPKILTSLVEAMVADSRIEVVTPVIQLSWEGLDALRQIKKVNAFSGTTCVRSPSGKALWFSKSILPVIREEKSLRNKSELSPVYRHIGIYCYRLGTLVRFHNLPSSPHEKLEGLEQLRLLENNIAIHTVAIESGLMPPIAGIDTPEDLKLAEKYIENSTESN